MKALLVCTVAALIALLTANPVAAQAGAPLDAEGSPEASGFWDWIHKLSGPEYMGGGFSYACGLPCRYGDPFRRRTRNEREPDGRVRVSFGLYKALNDAEVNPTRADLKMSSYQIAFEQRVVGLGEVGRLELGAAVAGNLFHGDHDSFWRASGALYPQLRFKRVKVAVLTVGYGIRVFQGFGENAFRPLNVSVDRDGLHAVGFLFGHLAFSR